MGERLLLPVVQRCPDGAEVTWIDPDPAADGPAPAVELVASTGGGHGATDAPVSDDTPTDVAGGEAAGRADSGGADDGTDALTIVALMAGLGGLALGGYAAIAARR